MRKLRFTLTFLILASMLVIFSQDTAGITANDLALKVEKKYRSLKNVSMDFTKIIRSDIFETENKIKGKMILKNPDKFKIRTKDQTIVCDGEFVWTYSVENKQVIKNLVDRSENLFWPNQYLSNFRSEYVPRLKGEEKVNRTKCFKLLLSPKKDDVFIKKMTIWVDKKNLLAKKLEYKDANDNEVVLIFQRIKTNRKIKDSEFIFQTPPGVEELDLSE
ncbi:MAG: outer membrane lipoprotein carrier protein LolA [candidate division Zixibacteria bacterium]|nr:outer membrane lipoprotein carrier protein LolA [candidate division Zixibacteria bacterium]